MIFLNSASSAAALLFYQPGVCTHTDTDGKQRKARVRTILKCSEKTQYLMNPVHVYMHIKERLKFKQPKFLSFFSNRLSNCAFDCLLTTSLTNLISHFLIRPFICPSVRPCRHTRRMTSLTRKCFMESIDRLHR